MAQQSTFAEPLPIATARASCCRSFHPQTAVASRIGRLMEWLIPSLILALIPKCPACLAVYIALTTGLCLSSAAAGYLWNGLTFAAASLLVLLTLNSLYRGCRAYLRCARSTTKPHPTP